MKSINSRRAFRFFGKVVFITLITLVLLEIITRLLWSGKTTINLLGRSISLLPVPLVAEEQKSILEGWCKDNSSYIRYDSVLGWSIRSNVIGEFDGITYTSNSIGVRSLREYDIRKPDNIVRIAAFGPSLTLGWGIEDSGAWPTLLEQSRSDLEVMNWGVCAYGTDQSFLRYKTEGVLYQPDIVLIGYEEDSVWRNANRYRPYYFQETGIPLTKPIYIVEQDELILLKNPFDSFEGLYQALTSPSEFVDATCPRDYFCDEAIYRHYFLDVFMSFRVLRTLIFEIESNRPLETESPVDPQETSIRIIELFVREAINHHSTPIVILFPHSPKTLSNYEDGILPHYHKVIPVIQDMMGIEVIDLTSVFVQIKQEQHLEYQDFFEGHYNKLGNQIVAQAVLQRLCDLGLIDCRTSELFVEARLWREIIN